VLAAPALEAEPGRARRVLSVACGAHFMHDAFSDLLYVFLPLWAAELRLSFTQVGVTRSAYSGGMALFQVPAGFLAERVGERALLGAGTAVTALGFVVAAAATGFWPLLLVLLVAGLGSGVQHPLSSSLVSQAYETGRRRAALGTYNFSGDLGKIAGSIVAGGLAALVGWRVAGAVAGGVGLLVAGLVLLALARLGAGGPPPRAEAAAGGASGWGIKDGRGFGVLTAIGMIDNATRTGFLTFLPFALLAKGATVAGVGVALALVFAGGAAGKFVCGLVAERLGVVRTVVLTEVATAAAITGILAAPLGVAVALLLPVGVALNGTSSVLYGTVADLVRPARRSRAYGLYYTLSVGASALAPSAYGLVGDVAGVPVTLGLVAGLILLTVPLALVLRPVLAVTLD
jgi:FSR family fosmidomycin resistance protein-like MFS transporter